MNLSPSQIRIDGGTCVRAIMSKEVIADYAEQMRRGMTFPPLTVFFDGTDYWLADGFHRFHAWLIARGRRPIAVEVIVGSHADALWHGIGANKTHGLRRTSADKARAVKAALRHPNGAEKSDRQIGEHVGVCSGTVHKYRLELEAASAIPRSTVRLGRDGRMINTAKIGRHRQACRKLSPRSAVRPCRGPEPRRGESGTTIAMPSDPTRGACLLIQAFDLDYIRRVSAILSHYLKGVSSCA